MVLGFSVGLAGPTAAGAARLGLIPAMGDGAPGRIAYVSGSLFEGSTLFYLRVGGAAGSTAAATSDALGAIAFTAVPVPALPRGFYDVLVASASLSRTYTGAYRVVPNLWLSPGQGDGRAGDTWQLNGALPIGGWSGMVFTVAGSGFRAGAVIPADSLTVGGAPTRHAAILVGVDGQLPSTTVAVASDLPLGPKDVTLNDGDSQVFAALYQVRRSIGMSPARGANVAGTTILVEGYGFADGTLPANAITVGGGATVHPAVPVTNGAFAVAVTLAGGLGSATNTVGAVQESFPAAYHAVPVSDRQFAVSPVTLSGVPNQCLRLEGLGNFGAGVIPANSTLIRTPSGDLVAAHAAVTVAGGRFPRTWSRIGGAVPDAAVTVRVQDPAGGPQDGQVGALKATTTTLPQMPLSVPGSTIYVSGFGLPPSARIQPNSVLIGGLSTNNAKTDADAFGQFGPMAVVLPYLPAGVLDVTLQLQSGSVRTLPGAVVVKPVIGAFLATGSGAAGEQTDLFGYGFPASSTIPADSITYGGLATTHPQVLVDYTGWFWAYPITLPALPGGGWDVAVAGNLYPAAYHTPAAARLAARSAAFPSPRNTGQAFLVTVTVTNTGELAAAGVGTAPFVQAGPGTASLVAGPTPAQPVALAAGQAVTFTWTFAGGALGTVAFSTTASGFDPGWSRTITAVTPLSGTVLIQTPAILVGSTPILTPALACQGQTVSVTMTVTNTGLAAALNVTPCVSLFVESASGNVTRLTSPAPVASLAGGAAATFTWTYKKTSPGTARFTATVTGFDANDAAALSTGPKCSGTLVAQALGALGVAVAAPPLVSVGQWFTVTVTVTNTGEASTGGVGATLTQSSGGAALTAVSSPDPAMLADLSAGGAAAFVWTFSAAGSGPVALTATATGSTCGSALVTGAANATLTVQTPATLVAGSPALSATVLCQGATVTIALTITNAGQAAALNVTPSTSLFVTGSGSAVLVSSPPMLPSLAGGAAASFTWVYQAGLGGTAAFTATVTGQDANAGWAAATAPATSEAVAIQTPGSLVAALAAPSPVSRGQWFVVSLTVTNTGQAAVTGVTATVLESSGAVTRVTGPVPAGPVSVAAGAAQTFAWTYSAAGVAAVTFSATGTGTTCQGVPAQGAAAKGITVQAAAALAAGVPVASATFVCEGQPVTFVLTVTNTGSAAALGVTPSTSLYVTGAAGAVLLASPAPVPSLAGGAAASFTWVYQAPAAGTATFTATVTGSDANAGWLVTSGPRTSGPVLAVSGGVLAAAAAAPATVSVGQWFATTLTVTNTGGADVALIGATVFVGPGGAKVVRLAGPSPASVAVLPAGAAATFTWTWSASGSGPVAFTLTAAGTTCGLSAAVAAATAATVVQTRAGLAARTVGFPSPRNTGQPFLVTVTVTNTGEATATGVTAAPPWPSGTAGASPVAGPLPGGPVVLAGGASVTFAWTFTATPAGTVAFTSTAAGTDANLGAAVGSGPAPSAPVTIQTPAALAAGPVAAGPGPVCAGQPVTVTLTVTNTGGATASGVTPATSLYVEGDATAVLLASPAALASLSGGSAATFTWTYQATAAGTLRFSGTATAADGNEGTALAAVAAASPPVTVQASGSLTAAASAPAAAVIGGWYAVRLTVTNTGGADVTGIMPAIAVTPGGAATLVGGPVPPGPVTLAAGAAATFTWTWSAVGSATVNFAMTATGTTCGGLPAQAGAGRAVGQVTPAALAAAAMAGPDPRDTGQSFLVSVTVTNTGGATVTGVTPGVPAPSGSGAAVLDDGPFPAGGVTLASGASVSFTWTATASTAGELAYTVTVTGFDGPAGALRSAAATTGTITVYPAPALAASLSATPMTVASGGWVTIRLTVTNTGTVDVVNLMGVLQPAGGAAWLTLVAGPVPAAPVTLAPGTATVFVWTCSASGNGVAVVAGSASGRSSLSGSPVGAGAGTGIAVAGPALVAAPQPDPAGSLAGKAPPGGFLVAPTVFDLADPGRVCRIVMRGTAFGTVRVRIFDENGSFAGSFDARLDASGYAEASLTATDAHGLRLGLGVHWVLADGGGVGGRHALVVVRRRR